MNDLTQNNVEHFTMQSLADLMGQNMTLVNAVAKEVGALSKRFDDMETRVKVLGESVEDSFADIRKDIVDIKENEEITYAQQRNIRNAVRNRVYELLGLPMKKADWEIDDRAVSQKYARLFFNRCYADVERMGHLRTPYGMTAKKDYDAAMAEIEAWRPNGGVGALKQEAEENALARSM